jgi:methanogenic corrinoid protein MtbC1
MGSFGENLKNIRKEKKLSQKKVAEHLGVGQTTIANYENDLRFPNPMILSQLSDILEVTVDELLGKEKIDKIPLDTSIHHENDFLKYVLSYDEESAIKLVVDMAKNGYDVLDIYEQVLRKTLYIVGDLWERNELSIPKEHYITEVVKKALFILSAYNKKKKKSDKTAIFMSPSSEPHLIGLKIVKETFKRFGWNTFYLGNSVPWDSLVIWIKEHNADIVVLSTTLSENVNQIEAIVKYIRSHTSAKVLIGGQAYHMKQYLVDQIKPDYFVNSKEELNDLLVKLS